MNKVKPRILIVDDDKHVRVRTRQVLERTGFVTDEAANGALALETARSRIPDLIILNVKMPVMGGLEACQLIRAEEALKYIPVIIVTGREDVSSIRRGFGAGATSFIVKPMRWDTLAYQIRYLLRNRDLEGALREATHLAEERVEAVNRKYDERYQGELQREHMALHDELTGLPNRALLNDLLQQAIAQARRNQTRVAVLMLDLDGFKYINDSLGHFAGDRLLEAVATRLHDSLREPDIRARLGGDEFVIALPDLKDHESGAAVVARDVLRALARPYQVEGLEVLISGSIGISLYPNDGDDPVALMRAADTAMYDAKSKGGGIYRFFTAALNETAQGRLAIGNGLVHAIGREEFVLHYQPQISLKSGIVTGVEALLRWNHPKRGIIPASEFIPILEETRQIIDVGKWVLRTACKQSVTWQNNGLRPIRMSVNISAVQFFRDDIVKTLETALRESGLSPEFLELEFTENLTLNDADTTLRKMRELKERRVNLAIDDFGVGWSWLSYLRRFPLDRIKIDQSFMPDLVSSNSDSIVVRNIIDLAENLGLSCIAEGVETVEQLHYLRRHMCTEMQGYFFSRPLPEAETTAFLFSEKTLDTKVAMLSDVSNEPKGPKK